MDKIDIVLASYNGEKYIKEQLESILDSNLFGDFINKIIISDDNSTNRTNEIVHSLACEKIIFVKNSNSKGVIGNFENALSYSDSNYVILCDQDDVWLPSKIECLLDGIKNIEGEEKEPALFFSDLKVVDKNLNILSDSFWNYQKINPENCRNLIDLIFRSVSPGCAMILNRRLIDMSLPFPSSCIMHDWWFILVAKAKGKVGFTRKATILYRQHDNNVLGAQDRSYITILMRLFMDSKKIFQSNILQASNLLDILSVEHEHYDTVKRIALLNDLKLGARLKLFFDVKTKKISLKGNLLLLFLLITYKS